jgi:hypothetical protein
MSADEGDRPPGPHALISCGSWRQVLIPGQSLTFGRAASHDLQIGDSPPDLRIPRTAGRLECRSDGVLIFNLSDKRSLTLQVFPGPEQEIEPLSIAGTYPHSRVRLILHGKSTTFSLMIDAEHLGQDAGDPASAQPESLEEATEGFARISNMSDRHRLLLTVLCLPRLTQSGQRAEVPSYAQMSKMLSRYGHSLKPHTVRNGLDDLRIWLTHEHGIPGLVEEREDGAPTPGGNRHMVKKLAEWAIRSGNVTREDLDRLG